MASSLDRPGSSSVSIRVIQSAQQQGVAEEAQQAGDVDLVKRRTILSYTPRWRH